MFSNKALRSLIIPLIIEQFLVISLGIFDTVMVTSVGESAMSGVSLVDMLNVLVIDIFAGLATGGAVVAAHYLGAGNDRGASRSGTQLILLAAFLGGAVAVIVIVFASPILRLLFGTVEADVMASALTYLKITALSFPFISVSNAAAAAFPLHGQQPDIDVFVAYHQHNQRPRKFRFHLRLPLGCRGCGAVHGDLAYDFHALAFYKAVPERSENFRVRQAHDAGFFGRRKFST